MKDWTLLIIPYVRSGHFGGDELMGKYPVQFIGVICWLPPHKPDRQRFPPGEQFTAIARFTSDLSGPVLEARVNYSPFPLSQEDCFEVRLHYHTLINKDDEIKRLARYTEILIMDGHRVIAVCRNISVPNSPIDIDDDWTPGPV
jgi:hypothetical protein